MTPRLYCGINEQKWNHHAVNPGRYACISPVYGRTVDTKVENRVRIPDDAVVLQDSGAFCDGPGERLSFEGALKRQIAHAHKYNYWYRLQAVASYDLLIDEKWIDGKRHKRRWSEDEAESAVEETIAAAHYLVSKRHALPAWSRLVLSAQGVTADQYLRCAMSIAPLLDLERDIFGLGGWCISGMMPKRIRPSFNATMLKVIPFVGSYGVRRVHIWGVVDPTFLGPLLWLCDRHGLQLSTDSAGPQRRPAFGEWGYRGWRNNNYQKAPVEMRGIHRAMHVRLTRIYLNRLRRTKFYHHPELPDGSLWSLVLGRQEQN